MVRTLALQAVDLYLSSGLFQSPLLSPCDVDGGSSLGELESDSFANTPGGTRHHTHPARQGHFLWKHFGSIFTLDGGYTNIKYQPEMSNLNVAPTKISDRAFNEFPILYFLHI